VSKLQVRESGREEWDELVDRCSLSTVYHRNGWIDSLSETGEADIRRVVCERGRELMAIWPVGLMRKGPLRVVGSPLPGWNTAYMGPVFAAACDDRLGAVRAMLRSKPIANPAFIATRCMDADLDLTKLGFERTRDFETYEIDLMQSEEDLFAAMKGTCRTRVRKGTKNGLVVRAEQDDAYLDDFSTMAEHVFAKSRQKPPYSRAFLRSLHDRLFPSGELLVTSAFHGEDRIATLIVPHDSHTAMYFAGGSFSDKLSLAPNNLLHWETIRTCKSMGLSRYDFISNSGKPGKFKKTFGPIERVSSVHWERSSNPVVKWIREKYEQRARARRKVRSG
jgi:CelD/BcsL family acetyltransferase involved in cellulose biosynthesis